MADDKTTDERAPNPATGQRESKIMMLLGAAVNLLAVSPFFAAGILGLLRSGQAGQPPIWASWAIIGFVGVVMVIFGIIFVFSRPQLDLIQGEDPLAVRRPSVKPAFAWIMMSVPFFAAAGFLVWFTFVEYLWPFLLFLCGTWLYLRGVASYWISRHTLYCVTNQRVLRRYRFIQVSNNSVRHTQSPVTSWDQNPLQRLTGMGRLRVVAGIDPDQRVVMENIDNPGAMDDVIHQALERQSNA